MKRILFALIALTAMASVSAQEIQIYRNNRLIETYTNTANEHYTVKFTDVGNLDKINGHEFVLINGLKWATMNVGATTVAESKETAYGDFYAWGEIATYYTKCPTDTGTVTSWKGNNTESHIHGNTYSHNWICYCGNHNKDNKFYEWNPKPYDDKNILKPEYDVARKSWGGTWRIPTQKDFINLINACGGYDIKQLPTGITEPTITEGGIYWVPAGTIIDTFQYDVSGFLFVSTVDPNNRVFFPAAGNIQNIKRYSVATLCTYWSSNIDKTDSPNAHNLYISSTNGITRNSIHSRCNGYSIRPVTD